MVCTHFFEAVRYKSTREFKFETTCRIEHMWHNRKLITELLFLVCQVRDVTVVDDDLR